MKMLVKVVDNPHLVRDTETNAVLNKDMDGLQAYKLRKKQSSKVIELAEKLGCEVAKNSVGLFVFAKLPSHISSSEAFIDKLLLEI